MQYPKISIITPSYNQGQFLEENILSVINQHYPNYEHIIMDGGSSDNTLEVIKKYEKHITYWESEKDRGQSHAMNKAIKKATGEYIGFVSSDDIIMPGSFLKIAKLFSELPDQVGLIHGGTLVFDQNKHQRINYGYENPELERYLSSIAFPFASSYIKKKYIDLVGLLDESLHLGMDYDLIVRLALVCDFYKVNFLLEKYRIHAKSKSFKDEKYFVNEWILVFVKLIKNLDSKWILDELKKMKVFDNEINQPFIKYDFKFEPKKINYDWMLCYFLKEVFSADYRNGNFKRATIISKYLQDNFLEKLLTNQEVFSMVQRINKYPIPLIEAVRVFKKMIA